MATASVVEYTSLASTRSEGFPAPLEPGVAQSAITIGTTTQSAAFATTTKLVRVSATAACHVVFGANPTATTAGIHIPAGGMVDFFVGYRSGLKLAVVAAS